jgi:GNAT superfamily N-acetyltransferase
MSLRSTKTIFLQMLQPPLSDALPAPRGDLDVQRIDRPMCVVYRQLYRAVGSRLNWVDRLVMPDEQLQAILQDERVDVFVLHVADKSAGYVELDRRNNDEIELAYFGLFPHFIGQGLGRFFLDWTLRRAWSQRPTRVWVHTCDLDHPAALPTYRKAGFQVYDEKTIAQFVPDDGDCEALPGNP